MIAIEHLLLAVKIVAAQLIPDVPAEVIIDERKRPKIEQLADDAMHKHKIENDLKTVAEMMDDIAAENL